MAMNETTLANKIKEIIIGIRTEENNPDESMNVFCEKLAKAVVEEVRNAQISATCPNGKVIINSIK